MCCALPLEEDLPRLLSIFRTQSLRYDPLSGLMAGEPGSWYYELFGRAENEARAGVIGRDTKVKGSKRVQSAAGTRLSSAPRRLACGAVS